MANTKENPTVFRVVFTDEDRQRRKVLIPNLTPEYSRIMQVALGAEGVKGEILPLAGPKAVQLGKRYVHNDICFPAQLNVGELLEGLQSGQFDRHHTAIALSKNCNACRALQYYALARKALDDCGFTDVPIITSGNDLIGLHPGFQAGLHFRLKSLQGMVFVDAINDMRQKTLPYEIYPGETENVHARFLSEGMEALKDGFRPVLGTLRRAVDAFNAIPVDRSVRRPVVGIVGEILVNYHPTANYDIAGYLLRNGMEPYLPPIVEFFRQDVVNWEESARHGFSRHPWLDRTYAFLTQAIYNWHLRPTERLMRGFRFYEEREDIRELAHNAEGIIEQAFNSGEGWLMPGEIIGMIKKGVRSFVIVQPFGCLPNHISGRGTVKAIKERHPNVQILSLDYDPDISMGNVENRLQMLIINAKKWAREAHSRLKKADSR